MRKDCSYFIKNNLFDNINNLLHFPRERRVSYVTETVKFVSWIYIQSWQNGS